MRVAADLLLVLALLASAAADAGAPMKKRFMVTKPEQYSDLLNGPLARGAG
jgi:hypothetical protein